MDLPFQKSALFVIKEGGIGSKRAFLINDIPIQSIRPYGLYPKLLYLISIVDDIWPRVSA